MKIANFEIAKGKTFIIAEAGINHNGNVKIARELISAAKAAGADAIKFQSFRAEIMCDYDLTETKNLEGITKGTKSSYDMYKALELSEEDHVELFNYAKEVGIICFSSVFDPQAIDLVVKLNSPAIKISSGDLTYYSLIEKALASKLPVLISTGLASLYEICDCYEYFKKISNNFCFLHCISEYPFNPENANLNIIPVMKKIFDFPIGFSDHSEGTILSETAVAIGADIIEKHFTLDNEMDGPDQKLSLNPADFSKMVKNIRIIEKSLGSGYKMPTPNELESKFNSRRGIKFAQNLLKGHIVSENDFKIIKPASGLDPKFLKSILGKKLICDVKKSKPCEINDFEL